MRDTELEMSFIAYIEDTDIARGEGDGHVRVLLSTGLGTMTLNQTAGLTIDYGEDGTGEVGFIGSIGDVNDALAAGLIYDPYDDVNGADQLTIWVSDEGNFGAPSFLTAQTAVDIWVTPANDAPEINYVIGPQIAYEDTELEKGFIAYIEDVDFDQGIPQEQGDGQVRVSLNTGLGTMTLNQTAGLTIDGGANGTGHLGFIGSIGDVNDALAAGLTYDPYEDVNGADQLTIWVSDEGNFGDPSFLTAQTAVDIYVTPVNDAPYLAGVMEEWNMAQGTSTVIPFFSPIYDMDFNQGITQEQGDGQVRVALNASHGTLTLLVTAGLNLIPGPTARTGLALSGHLRTSTQPFPLAWNMNLNRIFPGAIW